MIRTADAGRTIIAILFCAIAATTASAQQVPHFETVESAGMRWYKGNTHTHTDASDGDSPAEVVARWYKSHDYDFLVISDHNIFVDPAALAHLVDSTFLLIPGEELTTRFESAHVHVNGLNVPHAIEPQTDSTLLGTVQKNVDAVRAVEGVPHINHPNFGWSLDAEILSQVKNDKLLEIFNGHPWVHNHGGGDSRSVEETWDVLLTGGMRIYGIAVDDAHHFQEEFSARRSNPGRGWVMVHAGGLDAGSILESMEAGRFYASTGVILDDIIVTPQRMEIRIRVHDSHKYRTEFIGSGGEVLHSTGNTVAVYDLKGTESYVRARVRDSSGAIAWVQPAFVIR